MSDDDCVLSPQSDKGVRFGLVFSEDDTALLTGDFMNRKRAVRGDKDAMNSLRKLGLGVSQLSVSAIESLPPLPIKLTCPITIIIDDDSMGSMVTILNY